MYFGVKPTHSWLSVNGCASSLETLPLPVLELHVFSSNQFRIFQQVAQQAARSMDPTLNHGYDSTLLATGGTHD
jgi:hypothetical protein